MTKKNNTIIYQIYPKSFQDSNHDGIGDLQGIINRLDYLQNLGINMIWLNPIYLSPQIDNGYDVEDYYQIDSIIGNFKVFEELVTRAHEKGIRVILDFVMNHTSDRHKWFKKACVDKKSKYHNYYLWEHTNDGSLPNNWASFFGGSVWEKVSDKDYYFHLFDKHMPDLNWNNPEVRKEMVKIAKFWLNKGVDGFRLDAFIHIVKAPFAQNVITDQKEPMIAEEYYANLPQVQQYLAEFISELKKIKSDIFILGEAASAEINLGYDYTKPNANMCDSVVTFRYFDELKTDSEIPELERKSLDMEHLKREISKWEHGLAKETMPTLYWNNHDMPRILSRFDVNNENQEKLAITLAILMYLQKGIPCIYYGEELGMKSLPLKDRHIYGDNQVLDVIKQAKLLNYSQEKIDIGLSYSQKMSARMPMPWSETKYQGFSEVEPWLQSTKNDSVNVVCEESNKKSCLNSYKKILKLKQTPLFIDGECIILPTQNNLYAYTRNFKEEKVLIICNVADTTEEYYLKKQDFQLILKNGEYEIIDNKLTLFPYSSVILKEKVKE